MIDRASDFGHDGRPFVLPPAAGRRGGAGDRAEAPAIYVGLLGPSYETPAEIRIAFDRRRRRRHAIAPEATVARQMGMEVLGLCITNMAAGMPRNRSIIARRSIRAHRVRAQFIGIWRASLAASDQPHGTADAGDSG
jgi:hypothetical protein